METNKFELDKIMSIIELKSELEVEQASSLASRLRWMQKENESLKPLRSHLLELIEEYEDKHWTEVESITEEQIKESDNAELIVEHHNIFTQKRKEAIKASLKAKNLKQKDLALILGRSESYLSEQLNGIRQFSNNDIIILNKIFGVKLNQLFDLNIETEARERIKKVIKKFPNSNLKFIGDDLIDA